MLGMNQVGTGNDLANVILGARVTTRSTAKSGNDWLTGGAGADTFVFEKNSGHDVITDFYAGVSVTIPSICGLRLLVIQRGRSEPAAGRQQHPAAAVGRRIRDVPRCDAGSAHEDHFIL